MTELSEETAQKLLSMLSARGGSGDMFNPAIGAGVRVHVCPAFKYQKHYNARFPNSDPSKPLVPVSVATVPGPNGPIAISTPCPYCETPSNDAIFRDATQDEVDHLEGRGRR